MSYIGSTPTTQSFIAGTDYFNGTGSAVSFTLSRAVNSVNDIEVIVNNVEQIPSGYSVSGTTLTFSAAPSAGTSNVYVRYLSTTNLSLAIPAGTSATFNTVGVTGNLNFTGTGNRITGDFSNATIASRAMFQSSTTNGQSALGLLPNGTSTQTQYIAFNSTDPANSSYIQALISATEGRINSGQLGTGTNLPMTFYTGGSESLRLSATSKAVILAGGSTSANGTGITFPATQSASSDANTLDDYEEGLFTPSYSLGSGSGTFTTEIARYTKIGRIVTLSMRFVGSSVSGAANLNVAGLPFVFANSNADSSGGFREYTTAGNLYILSFGSSTSVSMQRYDNSNGLPNGAPGFSGTFTYSTN